MRTFRSCAQLMAAAAVGVMAVSAMAQSPDASANAFTAEAITEERGRLMLMVQSFDGEVETSHSQTASFARATRGAQSWTEVDYGNGAAVGRAGAQMVTGTFRNRSGPELGIFWDGAARELSGSVTLSELFNGPIAAWSEAAAQSAGTLDFTLGNLGFEGGTGTQSQLLERSSLTADGRALTLYRFSVPAFSYALGAETIVQWSQGAALAEASTGRLFWFASLHRAVGKAADRSGHPYRVAVNAWAMDDAGKPVIELGRIPELRPLMAALFEKGAAPLAAAAGNADAPDRLPIEIAARLDFATLARIEGGAGPMAIAVGGYLFETTGENIPVAVNHPLGDYK